MEVSQTLEEKVVEMGARLDRLESAVAKINGSSPSPEESVLDSLEPLLKKKYRGKFVALTYDKQVIDSADDILDIMDNMKERAVPNDQYFTYEVR